MSEESAIENYKDIFMKLQKTWVEDQGSFSDIVHYYLNAVDNPYELILRCLKYSPGLYKHRSSSMTSQLVMHLEDFHHTNKDNYKLLQCLNTDIQVMAFKVAVSQKSNTFIKSIIGAYNLKKINKILLPLVKVTMNANIKEGCFLAMCLDLHSEFTTSELLIPLFLQDYLPLIEQFLDGSPPHQIEFLQFLDRIVGQEVNYPDLLLEYNMREGKNLKSSRSVSSIAVRLIKKYGLDYSHCINVEKRRFTGGMKFLFYRHYIEKCISAESFRTLINELVSENMSYKDEALELYFEYNIIDAIPFIEYFKIPLTEISPQIQQALTRTTNVEPPAVQPEADWGDSLIAPTGYFNLGLPEESIHFVDNAESFEKCLGVLNCCDAIGIDCEWNPSLGLTTTVQLCLLQIATKEEVFLIDLINIPSVLTESHWVSFGQLLKNDAIKKLVYGFGLDSKMLAEINCHMEAAMKSVRGFVDLDEIKRIIKEAKPELYSFHSEAYKGLSELVYYCFGKPLSKTCQISHWSTRPLSAEQIEYAALDASCLVSIHYYLLEKCQQLGIDDYIKISKPQREGRQEGKKASPSPEVLPCQVRNLCLTAPEVKVVCDTMIQGLSRLLRHCGIDSVMLENTENHTKCIEYYKAENRIVLTKGNVYHQLRKYIPSSHIYCVSSTATIKQLVEVVKALNISVKKSDIFGRCGLCNSRNYLVVPRDVMTLVYDAKNPSETQEEERKVVEVKGGTIDITAGSVLETGVPIQCDQISSNTLTNYELFYVCQKCGKCHWDGSHGKLISGVLSQVINDAGREIDPVPAGPSGEGFSVDLSRSSAVADSSSSSETEEDLIDESDSTERPPDPFPQGPSA